MKKLLLMLLVVANLCVAEEVAVNSESETAAKDSSFVEDFANGATEAVSDVAEGATYAVVGTAGVITFVGLSVITLPLRLFQ